MEFDPEQLPVPDLGLTCRHCGYALNGLTRHRCPECGHDFTLDEFIPRGDFPPVIIDGREIRIAPEIETILRRAGILFMDARTPLETLKPLFNAGQARERLAVPRSDYFRAVWLIRQWLRDGTAPPPIPPREDWTCSACGEENPGAFELCWQCGNDREAGRAS